MFFEGHCNTPQQTKTLTLRDHVKRIAIHCLLYLDMDLQNILQTNHVVSKPSQMCFGMSLKNIKFPLITGSTVEGSYFLYTLAYNQISKFFKRDDKILKKIYSSLFLFVIVSDIGGVITKYQDWRC